MASAAVSSTRPTILGVPLDGVTAAGALAEIDAAILDGRLLRHGALNAAKAVAAERDPVLRRALGTCELVTADGQAVVWAARLLGLDAPERVAGIDLLDAVAALAARRGYGVFLLGARQDVLDDAAAALVARHPALRVVGRRHGYFRREEEPEVVAEIAASGADVLFVALATPEKELFVARHGTALGVHFAMGVGGAFDVLAGRLRRAPGWAQRAGLEWLFRLAQEPRRLAGRYLVGNARFVWLVGRELARGRSA